jgi:hypothetical protein
LIPEDAYFNRRLSQIRYPSGNQRQIPAYSPLILEKAANHGVHSEHNEKPWGQESFHTTQRVNHKTDISHCFVAALAVASEVELSF